MKTLILCVLLLLSGCAEWPTEIKVEEAVYQSLSVIDAAQTAYGIKHGYVESAKLAVAFGGREPSTGTVLCYRAAWSLLHLGITELLEKEEADIWAKRTWQFSMILDEGKSVWINFKVQR